MPTLSESGVSMVRLSRRVSMGLVLEGDGMQLRERGGGMHEGRCGEDKE